MTLSDFKPESRTFPLYSGFRVDQVNFAEQVDMPDGDSGQGADNDQEGDQHMDQGASTSGVREFHGQPPVAVR